MYFFTLQVKVGRGSARSYRYKRTKLRTHSEFLSFAVNASDSRVGLLMYDIVLYVCIMINSSGYAGHTIHSTQIAFCFDYVTTQPTNT